MSTNFRDALNDNPDDLAAFDTASTGDDLAAFDDATGATHIPAGWCDCYIVRGEVVTTKKGKPAFRLTLDVRNGPHAGFRLWRYFTFETPANANRAKAALAPLGLRTSADLRKPFPGAGRAIALRVLVTVQDRPDGTKGNNIERFEVTEDKTVATNPNAVNPDDFASAEGGEAVNPDPTDFDPGAPPPAAVGAFVCGHLDAPRQVVRWGDQFRDHHELAGHVNPAAEAYLSLFCYPPAPYCAHFAAAGYSPRGYAGSAGCRYLLFDIDRRDDLEAALADARVLVRFLLSRYAPHIDAGLGVYFSGSKGFHVLVELLLGVGFSAAVPATCKRLALLIAAKAGVRIDTGCFDHQRLVRLPNSKHPATGLHKRFLPIDELLMLDVDRIKELARHPAGFAVPSAGEFIPELEADWLAAAVVPTFAPVPTENELPTVPKYVLDFIGFQDVQDPGRAVTLFRCAAALAEADTPDAVIRGLLEEPAYKTGLESPEVARQIATGIAHGRRNGGAG